MHNIKRLWWRILGMKVRTKYQWRVWAIEQAVKSGSIHPVDMAYEIMSFVFFEEMGAKDCQNGQGCEDDGTEIMGRLVQ